jgi:Arc/MetJ-type ribon-helix-helix transcriptional regulator
MTSPRRRTGGQRNSHTLHIDDAVWDGLLRLCRTGEYANPSDATEKALRSLLSFHSIAVEPTTEAVPA